VAHSLAAGETKVGQVDAPRMTAVVAYVYPRNTYPKEQSHELA